MIIAINNETFEAVFAFSDEAECVIIARVGVIFSNIQSVIIPIP